MRVVTLCSGLDAPIVALKQLGVPFEYVMACESDRHLRAVIQANHPPATMYDDVFSITARDLKHIGEIDLVVAGPPCQPYSSLGRQRGLGDERSDALVGCIRCIGWLQPKCFVIENVTGLKHHDKGQTWR